MDLGDEFARLGDNHGARLQRLAVGHSSHRPATVSAGLIEAGRPLTHAASIDCILYLINRGFRRQGIGSRSN